MRLASARKFAAHLAVGFAFVSTISGGDIPTPVIALFAAVWLASLVFGERLGRGRSGVFTAITGVVLLALAALWIAGAFDLVIAASLFTIAMAANRLLSRQSAADDGLLYLSALLMLAGGAALSADLLYGICFAGFTLSITAALTLSHLSRAVEEARAPAGVADRLVARRLLGALFALSAVALAGSIAVFFLFPRFTAGMYARQRPATRTAGVGFSEQLRLGGHGTLKSDSRAALHVRFPRDPGVRDLEMYWKGLAYDSFDGRAWTTTARPERPRMMLQRGSGAGNAGIAVNVEVLETASTNTVFQLGRVEQLGSLHRTPSRRGAPQLWFVSDDAGNIRVQPRPEVGFGYEMHVLPEPDESTLRGRGREYPEGFGEVYLQLPETLDPRIPELAKRLTAGLEDPYLKAKAIERELSTRYRYTLELPGEVADPLAYFLFDRRAGHCEFFSTAMTVLLRASGVPARNVTGFFGGRRSGSDGTYSVRVGDAHSWAEAWFPNAGFVPFDPTPPEGRTASPSAVLAFLVDLYERASESWRTNVVDLTFWDQLRATRSGLDALLRGLERLQDRTGAGAGPALRAILALAVLGAALGLAARLWRPSGARIGRRPPDAGVKLYRALLRRLEGRGFRKLPGQTPRELARTVAAAGDPGAAAVAEITERYLAARFGGRALGPHELKRLRALVRTI